MQGWDSWELLYTRPNLNTIRTVHWTRLTVIAVAGWDDAICMHATAYSESATAIARPQRNSACCCWLPKGRPSHKHSQMWKSVIFMYGDMQLQWRAHLFPPETGQKCVALHHGVAKGCTVWPSCQINFVSVIDEFARRKARKGWQSQSDHLNEWTLSRVAYFLQVKCLVVRVANKMSSD